MTMSYGPKGMSIKESVYEALEVHGDRTRLEYLRKEASKIYGGEVSYHSTCSYRLQWRSENKCLKDCRTYEAQPMRNMVAPNVIGFDSLERINAFLESKSSTKEDELKKLQNLIGKGKKRFTTVEQLLHALAIYKKLQLNFKKFSRITKKAA